MATLSSNIPAVSTGTQAVGAERWLTRAAYFFAGLAALGLLLHLGSILWAQHEFSQPESIVAAQSTMLAIGGKLYPSLKDYPYTVNAYMPVFYFLEAGMVRAGMPPATGGRLISFVALLGILLLSWKTVTVFTGSRHCAVFGTLLCACTSLLLQWGSVGQVDMLAVMLSLAAFYQFSRFHVLGEASLGLAVALCVAALTVKQTVVAAPATIFMTLLFQRPKAAFSFGIPVAASVGLLIWVANSLTGGGFLANTVFANMNPFEWDKISQHTDYMMLASGQLILVVGVCAASLWKGPSRALLIYLGLAASVLAVTAPKIGSDSNYQIEATILLAWCSAVGLHAVNFFPRFFAGDKALITLLHMPLGIHMVLNLRLMYPTLLSRIVREQLSRQQVEKLRQHLTPSDKAISADVDAALHLQGRIEVEPLIYTLLVKGGQIDPEPVRRDLAGEKFATLVLYSDLTKSEPLDPEIPQLVESQNQEIRRHYKMVANIPGPYLKGVYVYKPMGRPE